MESLRFAIAQINPLVGDLSGNCRKMAAFTKKALSYQPDILIFPELSLSGYPPEDLVLKPHFRKDCRRQLEKLLKNNNFKGLLLAGYVEDYKNKIYNSIAVIRGGKIVANYRKICLPNYGVFDERRYFSKGGKPVVLVVNGVHIALTICEDIWTDNDSSRFKVWEASDAIINISASPYHMGKIYQRIELLESMSRRYNLKLIYANQVGAQDELVFDGASMVVDRGRVVNLARQFSEDLIVSELHFGRIKNSTALPEAKTVNISSPYVSKRTKLVTKKVCLLDDMAEVYAALVLGVKDYVKKNGFSKVVIGLSGGIDSSLVAVIAKDALGADSVLGVLMPSAFSSKSSLKDALGLAGNLDIKILNIKINDIYDSYLKTMKPSFKNLKFDKTEENIQARIRGNILMALSNKFGYLVLTTGNKSEVSVGYCTLYGDMAGGFAVIKDLTKTLEYKLAGWRNSLDKKPLIPENVFLKPPSAELRPNQKDQDSLPDYEVLDKIIIKYIEEDMSFDEIVNLGFDKNTVRKVIRMIDSNEYKRRQSPPGIKITPKSFGKDRRMPITCGYRV